MYLFCIFMVCVYDGHLWRVSMMRIYSVYLCCASIMCNLPRCNANPHFYIELGLIWINTLGFVRYTFTVDWNFTETEIITLLTSSYNFMENTRLTVYTTKYYPVGLKTAAGNTYPGSKYDHDLICLLEIWFVGWMYSHRTS